MTNQELVQAAMAEVEANEGLRIITVFEADVADSIVLASLLTIGCTHPLAQARGKAIAKSFVGKIAEQLTRDGMGNCAAVARLGLAQALNQATAKEKEKGASK